MANNHGARQQKRAVKHKAKRTAKRAILSARTSTDPTIRLRSAATWPVIEAIAGSALWDEGIGYLCIARENPQGELAIGVFLVDAYCLGVKNAFWQVGTRSKLDHIVEKLEATQTMRPIAPAFLAKIVRGAVDYAQSFGFRPHSDYGHTALLLEGIDSAACPEQFEFGREGKPFYIQGPNESTAQAMAIAEAIHMSGGHYIAQAFAAEHGALSAEHVASLEYDSSEADDQADDDF